MQDRLHGAVELAFLDALQELVAVEVVGDLAVGEVHEFRAVPHVVDGDDVGHAARVQRLDEVGADEAGGAGDYVVHASLRTA